MPDTFTASTIPAPPPQQGDIIVVDKLPGTSAIQQAIDRARADTESQGSDRSLRAQTAERDEGGRFVKAQSVEGAGEPEAEVLTEPTDEETSEAVNESGELTEEAPEETPEESSEALVAELPPRHEGDDPFVIETDDPDLVERINQLKNGYARGEMLRREREALEADRGEFRFMREAFEADPPGFLLEHVRPDYREDLVLRLLATDGDLYTKIFNRIDAWAADPRDRELELARIEAREAKRRYEQGEARREHDVLQARARDVREAVYALIPDAADDGYAQRFIQDALNDIRLHVQATGAQISGPHVAEILKDRLRIYGWEPGSPAGSSNGANGRATVATARPPAAPTGPGAPAPVTDQGEKFRVARARARTVAATPAGTAGGAASSTLKPPTGTNLKDAFEFAKGRLKFS